MDTIAYHTFGCKLNFSETSSISRMFKKKGFKNISIFKNPKKIVINTCSVTENADKKCKDLIKKIKRKSPDSEITVIGCYAQLKPKEIEKLNGVDKVLGNKEKFEINNYFINKKERVIHSKIEESTKFNFTYSIDERTRSFLKVQDGCNYGCSFCTIPLARGKSRSSTTSDVLKKIDNLILKGSKEIVLSGINIGDFGIIDGKRKETFKDLISKIEKINKKIRFRISSIEPNLLNDDIINLIHNSKKFLNHFHIPLQSGSNKILKKMSRRYNRELYQDKINKIKKLMPKACIGADVIVGFPGESNKDFNETYKFINKLDIDYLHVFPYSERNNTRAKLINDVLPLEIRNKRSKMLRILSEKKKRKFYENNLNSVKNVLFEKGKNKSYLYGFSENYVRVKIPYNKKLSGKIKSTLLNEIDSDLSVRGKIILK